MNISFNEGIFPEAWKIANVIPIFKKGDTCKSLPSNHRPVALLSRLVVVDFLFIVTPIVGVCNCSMFCCTLLYIHSSIAIILMGKRELIALLGLSSWCLVMVERLFLAMPRGCLQFVIVVFPDHTHLLFLVNYKKELFSRICTIF